MFLYFISEVKGTGRLHREHNKTSQILRFNADDFVYPSSEADALFVTTKYVLTTQEQGVCEG